MKTNEKILVVVMAIQLHIRHRLDLEKVAKVLNIGFQERFT